SGSGNRLVRNGRDCRREDLAPASRQAALRLVLRKEFDHRLSALRTADKELVAANRLDAQSRFLGAMQERYSIHSLASSSFSIICIRPSGSSARWRAMSPSTSQRRGLCLSAL